MTFTFAFALQCVMFPIFPYPHKHLLSAIFMVTVILVDMKQHLIVVWICISMMTNGLEDIFMCTLAISASSLRKCLFESFTHFKIVLFIFLSLHLSCSLHIPDTNLLWGI